MSFAVPLALWALLAIPLLIGLYLLAQRQRARYAVRFTNTELLAGLVTGAPRWRRHLPAALFVLALTALLASLARPETTVLVPKEQATVVLLMDVSKSMEADDVSPTRLVAAQTAAKRFTERVPDQFQLGLVAFSGTAQVVTSPTTDRRIVQAGIDSLYPGPGTAIGDGIMAGLAMAASDEERERGTPGTPGTTPQDPGQAPGQGQAPGTEPPIETDRPVVLLLLSDGANSAGMDPQVAAARAAQANVPVFTIALGTPEGVIFEQNGDGSIVPIRVVPDEPTLQRIADLTNGRFFRAPTDRDLQSVYDELGSRIGFERERRDVTVWFATGAAILLLAAGLASLRWFSRLP